MSVEAVVARGQAMQFVAASHEDQLNPGSYKKVLFGAAELPSGKLQMVNWAKIPAGKGFQLHLHQDMHEVFVIIAGEAEMTTADSTVVLGPGDAILIPPNLPHSMRALSTSVDVDYVVFGVSQGQSGKTVVLT